MPAARPREVRILLGLLKIFSSGCLKNKISYMVHTQNIDCFVDRLYLPGRLKNAIADPKDIGGNSRIIEGSALLSPLGRTVGIFDQRQNLLGYLWERLEVLYFFGQFLY